MAEAPDWVSDWVVLKDNPPNTIRLAPTSATAATPPTIRTTHDGRLRIIARPPKTSWIPN